MLMPMTMTITIVKAILRRNIVNTQILNDIHSKERNHTNSKTNRSNILKRI